MLAVRLNLSASTYQKAACSQTTCRKCDILPSYMAKLGYILKKITKKITSESVLL